MEEYDQTSSRKAGREVPVAVPHSGLRSRGHESYDQMFNGLALKLLELKVENDSVFRLSWSKFASSMNCFCQVSYLKKKNYFRIPISHFLL